MKKMSDESYEIDERNNTQKYSKDLLDHLSKEVKKYKTFKELKHDYTIEKWFHKPKHYLAYEHCVCYLSNNMECYKDSDNSYIVTKRRFR